MKHHSFPALLSLCLILSGCSTAPTSTPSTSPVQTAEEAVSITLSDQEILVDGQAFTGTGAVTLSHDIVYYEADQGTAYGEGSPADEHPAEEAAAHSVITIREPGTYRISGTLSQGQIAVDLGEDADNDPAAVVTLILDQAEITCTVAPSIIVYHAYECADEQAQSEVNTQAAGFNLIVADNTENYVKGAYVAKIYQEGTTKKLHKYDGAIESKVSMNLDGETEGNGILNVEASNEGIETAMHMTINGGNWFIHSADDSLNANEDGISVITINDGTVRCDAGAGEEGDGIDSNGWIVINGGMVLASANPTSMDSGLDSDNGIVIHGGTVLATGNMFDEIDEASTQNVAVFSFAQTLTAADWLVLADNDGQPAVGLNAQNAYTILIYSSPQLDAQEYTLAQTSSVKGEDLGGLVTSVQSTDELHALGYSQTTLGMGMRPQGGAFGKEENSQTGTAEDGRPQGERPQPDEQAERDHQPPADLKKPEEGDRPIQDRQDQGAFNEEPGEVNSVFSLQSGISMFSGIRRLEEAE